jgi:hypothetical protein
LIATLETTKAKAGEITVKLAMARETGVEIDMVNCLSFSKLFNTQLAP